MKPAQTAGKKIFGLGALQQIDKKKLPIQKKPVNPPTHFVRSPKEELTDRSKILRPVKFFTNGEHEVLDVTLTESTDGHAIFRADSKHILFTTLQVVGDPCLPKARVCICRNEVPTNWIYFEVIGFGTGGKVTFVRPVTGTTKELLKQYCFKLRGKNYLREEKAKKGGGLNEKANRSSK
jgi:hypothetical protein